ncbi:MAG: TIM barrel protein [Phycisphaeraceae bacterium]|nr:TIM barrel protein [Phycisphaeraceae bacterium]
MRYLSMRILIAAIVCSCVAPVLAQTRAELQTHLKKPFKNPKDDRGLPRVLLIGDSISIGYTVPVRKELAGVASVHRIPTNGRDASYGLANLDKWLGEKKWDVIHFNWGLWDICYRHPESKVQGNRDKVNGKLTATPGRYRASLEAIVQKLKKTGAKLIWCATTPVPEGEAGRKVGDEIRYNAIAAEVMKAHGVAINDLHAHAKKVTPGAFIRPGDVHFTKAGSAHLAKKVAAEIKKALDVSVAPRPFFVFGNGLWRAGKSPAEHAALLKKLGYDGAQYNGTQRLPEILKAYDEAGLKLFAIYVGVTAGKNGPVYSKGLKEAIEQLKGRRTVIWMTVRNRKGVPGDDGAVEGVRQVGRWAKAADLGVALYPHAGFHVAQVEDAVRLADKVNMDNVGVSFNLCHFLKTDRPENLEKAVAAAAPRLMLVSINGADFKGGWGKLIQPLGRGRFDTARLMKLLDRHGYRGPIGLQCYGVKGDQQKNLAESMAAWRKLHRN